MSFSRRRLPYVCLLICLSLSAAGVFDVLQAATEYSAKRFKAGTKNVLPVPGEVVVTYALDAGSGLETTAFSTVASLASVVHNSKTPQTLRFVFLFTMPEPEAADLATAMCRLIDAAVGKIMRGDLPTVEEFCSTYSYAEQRSLALKKNKEAANNVSCDVGDSPPTAKITFVTFPSRTRDYPRPVARLLELLCCSQRRYHGDRPELAKSLGNHARFFAHLALLPLGIRRSLFLDADTLTRADVGSLFNAPLTARNFVGAARRCASRRAAYKPRFKFKDPLVVGFGLKSEGQHINAGMLLMDLHAYCDVGMVEDLQRILERHVAGPPLWHQGNNQPPFTIAAASHLTFVHPSWNVRPGDADAEARVVRARGARAPHDDCAEMVAAPPLILHAHFSPCDALPPRLCATNHPSSRELTLPLKKAVDRARSAEAKLSKLHGNPCGCTDIPKYNKKPRKVKTKTSKNTTADDDDSQRR